MLLGILSDSHGRAETTALAVSALLDAGCTRLVHLGDFETDQVVDELVGHDAHIVFGNCDWDEAALRSYARSVGVQVDHPVGRLVEEGRRIVFTHGHIESHLHDALHEGVEYLLHGHTHQLRDERIGRTRVINPGALFRANRYTVAVLDPQCDEVRFLEIPKASKT